MPLEKFQRDLFCSDKSRNILHCGVGTGKTHTMGAIAAAFALNCPTSLGLIAANTYGQLSDSTLVRIFDYWSKEYGWEEDIHYVIDKKPLEHFTPHDYTFKTNNNKIFLENGHVITLASLDNYKAIDGRELGYALLDETKDTREQAIKDTIITRLRQRTICTTTSDNLFKFVNHTSPNSSGKYINPLFVFTSPSKEEWIADWFKFENYRQEILGVLGSKTDHFYVSEENRTIVIGSTYLNPHNPPSYVEDMVADLTQDRIELNIYGSPFGKSGAEYYANYSRDRHVKPCPINYEAAFHLGFDFNSHPYMTGLVCQVVRDQNGRLKVRFIREYPMTAPRNKIESVCRAFLDDFEKPAQDFGFYYYGDASGKNSIPLEEYQNYFDVVKQNVRTVLRHNSRRLLKANPRHRGIKVGSVGRRDFLNSCLKGRYGFDIEIDPSCKHLIADLEYIKEDKTGAKLKEKAEINGVRCEKYGHFSDALDSIICYLFGNWAKE